MYCGAAGVDGSSGGPGLAPASRSEERGVGEVVRSVGEECRGVGEVGPARWRVGVPEGGRRRRGWLTLPEERGARRRGSVRGVGEECCGVGKRRWVSGRGGRRRAGDLEVAHVRRRAVEAGEEARGVGEWRRRWHGVGVAGEEACGVEERPAWRIRAARHIGSGLGRREEGGAEEEGDGMIYTRDI